MLLLTLNNTQVQFRFSIFDIIRLKWHVRFDIFAKINSPLCLTVFIISCIFLVKLWCAQFVINWLAMILTWAEHVQAWRSSGFEWSGPERRISAAWRRVKLSASCTDLWTTVSSLHSSGFFSVVYSSSETCAISFKIQHSWFFRNFWKCILKLFALFLSIYLFFFTINYILSFWI